MAPWDNFFVAQVGASAALAGLLFVGISLNMTKILKVAVLPDRALQALVLLMTILVAASLTLVPGAPDPGLGIEILGVGVVAVFLLATLARRVSARTEPPWRNAHRWESMAILSAGALYPLAGGLLIVGAPGYDALVPAFLLSYVVAILISWILLVEINR